MKLRLKLQVETQIEASSRNPKILPCVSKLKKLKKCAISSKRQCSLSNICTETVCSFVFCFLTGGGEGDLFFIIQWENCTSVFTRNILMMKNEDNSDGGEIWAC